MGHKRIFVLPIFVIFENVISFVPSKVEAHSKSFFNVFSGFGDIENIFLKKCKGKIEKIPIYKGRKI